MNWKVYSPLLCLIVAMSFAGCSTEESASRAKDVASIELDFATTHKIRSVGQHVEYETCVQLACEPKIYLEKTHYLAALDVHIAEDETMSDYDSQVSTLNTEMERLESEITDAQAAATNALSAILDEHRKIEIAESRIAIFETSLSSDLISHQDRVNLEEQKTLQRAAIREANREIGTQENLITELEEQIAAAEQQISSCEQAKTEVKNQMELRAELLTDRRTAIIEHLEPGQTLQMVAIEETSKLAFAPFLPNTAYPWADDCSLELSLNGTTVTAILETSAGRVQKPQLPWLDIIPNSGPAQFEITSIPYQQFYARYFHIDVGGSNSCLFYWQDMPVASDMKFSASDGYDYVYMGHLPGTYGRLCQAADRSIVQTITGVTFDEMIDAPFSLETDLSIPGANGTYYTLMQGGHDLISVHSIIAKYHSDGEWHSITQRQDQGEGRYPLVCRKYRGR